jgi:pimeloyl-ACP methyl ester carboxylesterase
VRLSGWYVPSANGAAVAVLHGAGTTRTTVLDHAVVLARNGYGVLLYDARGHGRSEGRGMDFGWYGDLDIAGAVTFLEARDDVDPSRIGVVGTSMGGEQAIGAAATDTRIRAVVAEGATNRVAADKEWQSEEFGIRGVLQEQVDRLTYGLVDLLTDASPPIALPDAVRAAAPRRMLLIAGESVPDEPKAARYFQRRSPATVEVWVVADTGHTAGLDTHPEEWEARVVAFLAEALW